MKLLVFGGNGFIGGECVAYLLDKGHEVTVLNRGHWPWDSEKRLKPRTTWIACDRNDPGDQQLDRKLGQMRFDAIIDFSATERRRLERLYPALRSRCDLYIYISSDSCYEVSRPQPSIDPVSGRPRASKETDAVRPDDPTERRRLAEADAYAEGKFSVEEFLQEQRNAGGIPNVFLRLPDVLGERDTTERWWKYQLWMEQAEMLQTPVLVPSFTEKLYTSYVDVLDVARVIDLVLKAGSTVHDQALNVAFAEPMRLIDLLGVIRQACGQSQAKLTVESGEFKFPAVLESVTGALKIGGDFYFPSVTRGPIDVTKLSQTLNWTPTSVEQFASGRAKQIAQFYISAVQKFPNEYQSAIRSLLADLGDRVPDANRKRLLSF